MLLPDIISQLLEDRCLRVNDHVYPLITWAIKEKEKGDNRDMNFPKLFSRGIDAISSNNITEDYAIATVPELRYDTNNEQRELSLRDAKRHEALVQARVKNKLAQQASRRKKRIQANREESNKQQKRLYNHSLQYCLQNQWHKAANSKSKPKSSNHFAIMNRLGNHILKAQAALCTLPDQDYFLIDLDRLDSYLKRN